MSEYRAFISFDTVAKLLNAEYFGHLSDSVLKEHTEESIQMNSVSADSALCHRNEPTEVIIW